MDFYVCRLPFRLICEIKPDKDPDGNLLEFFPQEKYKNKDTGTLNKYGRGPFCKFKIPYECTGKSGVYIIKIDNVIKYVGECKDLSQRFNAGYGNISPRNCYVGGQPTNCRINTNILEAVKSGSKVYLLFYETNDRFSIEEMLIKKCKPEWNVTRGNKAKNIKISPGGFFAVKRVKATNKEGKYYPLEQYLMSLDCNNIKLSFEDIERIIGDLLPPSARKYPAWWANGGHIQADAWLNAGWKVDEVSLGNYVVFVKEK